MTTTDHPRRVRTSRSDTARRSTGSDPLTAASAGLLAAVATAGAMACLIYAVWWLVTFWAPT